MTLSFVMHINSHTPIDMTDSTMEKPSLALRFTSISNVDQGYFCFPVHGLRILAD